MIAFVWIPTFGEASWTDVPNERWIHTFTKPGVTRTVVLDFTRMLVTKRESWLRWSVNSDPLLSENGPWLPIIAQCGSMVSTITFQVSLVFLASTFHAGNRTWERNNQECRWTPRSPYSGHMALAIRAQCMVCAQQAVIGSKNPVEIR